MKAITFRAKREACHDKLRIGTGCAEGAAWEKFVIRNL
jgi:hypothetical protein